MVPGNLQPESWLFSKWEINVRFVKLMTWTQQLSGQGLSFNRAFSVLRLNNICCFWKVSVKTEGHIVFIIRVLTGPDSLIGHSLLLSSPASTTPATPPTSTSSRETPAYQPTRTAAGTKISSWVNICHDGCDIKIRQLFPVHWQTERLLLCIWQW